MTITELFLSLGGRYDEQGRKGYASWRKEKTPSVTFNDGRGVWYDHGAGEGGQSGLLIARMKEISHAAAMQELETAGAVQSKSAGEIADAQEQEEAQVWLFGLTAILDERIEALRASPCGPDQIAEHNTYRALQRATPVPGDRDKVLAAYRKSQEVSPVLTDKALVYGVLLKACGEAIQRG